VLLAVAGVQLGAGDAFAGILRVEVEGEPLDRGAEPAPQPLGPLVADVAVRSDVVAPDRDGVLGHRVQGYPLSSVHRPSLPLTTRRLRIRVALALLALACPPVLVSCSGGSQEQSAGVDGCAEGWRLVESPGGAEGLIDVVTPAAGDVWAAGERTEDGRSVAFLGRWAGDGWQAVPSPQLDGSVTALSSLAAVSADDLWAVGYTASASASKERPLIQHWDGSSWMLVPGPDTAEGIGLTDVSASAVDDVWAVGATAPGSGALLRYAILHWDGSAWKSVLEPEGEGGLLGVDAVSRNDAWAVGFREGDAGDLTTLALHWNGTSWQPVPTPSDGAFSVLYRVAAVASDDAWAVGASAGGGVGEGRRSTLIQHWDGTRWREVESPSVGDGDSVLVDVAAAHRTDVWAVGYRDGGTLVVHWDGERWTAFPSPGEAGALQGVSVAADGVWWAVGQDGSAPLVHRLGCER